MQNHAPFRPVFSVNVGCEDGSKPALLARDKDIFPHDVQSEVVQIEQAHPLNLYAARRLTLENCPPAFRNSRHPNQQRSKGMDTRDGRGGVPHLHHRNWVGCLEGAVKTLLCE
jgi:hypothetical protein